MTNIKARSNGVPCVGILSNPGLTRSGLQTARQMVPSPADTALDRLATPIA
jgi:hypothetical protein